MGTSFVAGKVSVEGTDPYLFTALRSAVAALSLVPMLFLADFGRPPSGTRPSGESRS